MEESKSLAQGEGCKEGKVHKGTASQGQQVSWELMGCPCVFNAPAPTGMGA